MNLPEGLQSVLKNPVTTLFKGNLLSKAILVAGGIFLAKFYGASAYGIFTLYLSILAIASALYSFSLENILMVHPSKNTLPGIYNASALLVFAAFLVSLIILVLPLRLSAIVLFQALLSAFFVSMTALSRSVFSRAGNFKMLASLSVTDATVSFGFQLLFAAMGVSDGLVLGSTIGFAIAFLQAVYFSRDSIIRPDWEILRQSVRERKEILYFTYPSVLINVIGNNLLPLLIPLYFAKSVLGEYALAVKIMSVPMLLISSSFAGMYYPKASELYAEGKDEALQRLTAKISKTNFLILLFLYALLLIVGIPVLRFYFTEEWAMLPLFIVLLCAGFLGRSLVNPVSDVLTIVRKNKVSLLFNVYLIAANLAALYVGCSFGIVWLVSSYSGLLFVGYGFLYIYIQKILKHRCTGLKNL